MKNLIFLSILLIPISLNAQSNPNDPCNCGKNFQNDYANQTAAYHTSLSECAYEALNSAPNGVVAAMEVMADPKSPDAWASLADYIANLDEVIPDLYDCTSNAESNWGNGLDYYADQLDDCVTNCNGSGG